MLDLPQSASTLTGEVAADHLDSDRGPRLLADIAMQMARRLREGGLDEFAERAGAAARARPYAFLIGSILIGAAMARFLKASGQRPTRTAPF